MKPLEIIVWLTGFDRGRLPPDASPEFTWTHPVQSWGLFVYLLVAAALAYFVFFLYRLEQQSVPRRVKALLVGMRIFVVLLLALIFLGPAITYNEERSLAPYVALLRDASQSMNSDDRYLADEDAHRVESVTDLSPEDVSRTDLVNLLLQRNEGKLLSYLEQESNLQVSDFSVDMIDATWLGGEEEEGETEGQEAATVDQAIRLAPLQSEGRGTDIYRALREAMTLDPLAAIILFTDGQDTRPETNPLDLVDPTLEGEVPPVFVIGVGDPTPPRDVRVTAVRADRTAYPGNPFPIDFILHTSGIETDSLLVELIEFDVNSEGEVVGAEVEGAGRAVAQKNFDLSDGNTLQFEYVSHEPGDYAYTVRVAPLEFERDVENNQFQNPARVTVREEKDRVLLVAGSPTWEYRFATQLLMLDPSVHVNCWLQTLDPDMPQEGNEPLLTEFPSTKRALFGNGTEEEPGYSAILLFDPDPRDFDDQWMSLLKEFVSDRAGGVLYMAGPKYSGLFLMSPRTAPLSSMLPIRVGDLANTELGARFGTNTRSWDLQVVEKNLDEPIMAFFPQRERSLAIWNRMPGPYWSFPATDTKPGSRILIDQSDPDLQQAKRPLLVTGRYGAGRTVYTGFNGTWRWRSPLRIEDSEGNARWVDGSRLYKRFWLQTVSYLIEGRLQEGKRRGWIRTDRDQYEVGERVAVTAQLYDAVQEPLVVAGDLEASLQSPDGSETEVTFSAIPNQPGGYQMVLAARRSGYHRLEIRLPGGADGASALEQPVVYAEFTVTLPALELQQPELDKAMLRQLAEMSGGAYLEVDEFDQLLDKIKTKISPQSIIVPGTTEPLWDTSNILLLAVGLLSVEWLVRKAYKML